MQCWCSPMRTRQRPPLDGLEARVADQKAVLESCQPDEVSKLDSAIVEQRGNSVLLAVAADAEKARAALDGLE